MQVKTFYEILFKDLETNINEFIKDIFVWDIKYQEKDNHYTALVMYSER